ncbi:hypothetical protein BJV78DRAFT_166897 [Lactifluus subvellereus]|nr:hypothetical protein BJV78DRAFT_166897 [Lactifluus subvellereus]
MSVSGAPSDSPPPPPYLPQRSRYNSTGKYQRAPRPQAPAPMQSHPVGPIPLPVVDPRSSYQQTLPPLSMIAGETAQRARYLYVQTSPHSSSRNPVSELRDHLTPPPSPSPSPSPSPPPPSSRSSSSPSTYSGTATATPSFLQLSQYPVGPPSEPLPPVPPISRNRPKFLNVLKLSKGTRQPATPPTELAARPDPSHTRPQTTEGAVQRTVEKRVTEEAAHRVSAQAGATDNVRSLIECVLSGRLPPDDERSSVLSACAQACELGGLDLSTVLQEMVIEGYPPIYWAIVNRGAASGSSGVALDSLVFALLDACRPLSPATLDAIRIACMTASDNVLLQRLFREIPPLSPVSARDALLLGPTNQGDHVDVEEKRDGTGSFVAHIQIPRFRLRMRVCKSVAVEFVASWRIWILRFNAVVETGPDGQPRSKWYLSLELGEHSQPTTVNASLLITGSLDPADNRDPDPTRTISFGCNKSELTPGRMLKVRLDDGPMGPHLLYEYVKTLAPAASKTSDYLQVIDARRFERDLSCSAVSVNTSPVGHRYFEYVLGVDV